MGEGIRFVDVRRVRRGGEDMEEGDGLFGVRPMPRMPSMG